MIEHPVVVVREGSEFPATILRTVDDWGRHSYDLSGPPSRFWADQEESPEVVQANVDSARVRSLPTPAQALRSLRDEENWTARSRASLGRLWAYYLLGEDPQRRLDARAVSTLAHQVSLVRHILDSEPRLNRVLIADEVGLGKTIEVGLLVKEWLERNGRLRILYLAPARLVNNVRSEFDRLGLGFRQWSASSEVDGRIDDPRLIASIHRAVHPQHFKRLVDTPRWDVIIVDECHHLSDWSPGGGDPTQKFKLVRELIAKQGPDNRVVFLSGTPHQGNLSRFENLLNLLKRDDEPDDTLAGRVIYRTKEDVGDWDGQPLFPGRQVATPLVVDLGPDYRDWIERIHDFFAPPKAGATLSEPRRRSANWRCAQALQWAASSPQAGLGYLVRQAVRAGGTPQNLPVLADALAVLRPYRLGPIDEPIETLFERICKEIDRQRRDADVEDIEEVDEGLLASEPDAPTLVTLLQDGIRLLRTSPDEKWDVLKKQILDPAGIEKVVLFAQPIETVTALAAYLERTTGVRPALIVGGQSDGGRQREIEAFRQPDGSRYLISSRAGGEGINLQVSRRLVHLDVPWNPMDMEQRVGRVHRFGSRQTILVETLVVKNSREEAAYRVAREKLAHISEMLVGTEKFETLFSRVMSLIPPEEFLGLIVHAPGENLTDEQQRLAEMVRHGYQTWDDFNRRFAKQQRDIRLLNPGLASWDDLRRFFAAQVGASTVDGFHTLRFRLSHEPSGPAASFQVPVPVLKTADGTHYLGQEHDGMPVANASGVKVEPLGLNIPAVAEALRKVALSPHTTGAAQLRWTDGSPPPGAGASFGVLVLLRHTLRSEGSRWIEQGLSLHCYRVDSAGTSEEWTGADRKAAIQGLLGASILMKPQPDGPLYAALASCEAERLQNLGTLSEEDRERRYRHAVWPLFAAIVTT